MCTLCNIYFLGPTQIRNPIGISVGSYIFAQLTAECRRACLKISHFPFAWGDLDPHLIHDSLGPSESKSQTANRSAEPFFGQFLKQFALCYRTVVLSVRSVLSACL